MSHLITKTPNILNKYFKMLRRHCSGSYKHVFVSDSETESEDNNRSGAGVGQSKKSKRNGNESRIDKGNVGKRNGKRKKSVLADKATEAAKSSKARTKSDQDALVELAKEYQRHMKKIPIPKARLTGSAVVNWQGLARTLKSSYGQPLHYLTCMLCKQWDHARFGSDDEGKPLDAILKWSKAESTIWDVEEVHRLSTSPIYLAKLWVSDPEYRAFVDEVLP